MATSVTVRCVSTVFVFTILSQFINAESYRRKISDAVQDIEDDPTFVQVSAEKAESSDHLIIPIIVENDLQTLQTKYEKKLVDSDEYNGVDSMETPDEKQHFNFKEEKKRVIRQASSAYPIYPNLHNAPPYGQNSANTNNNYYPGYPNYNEPGRYSSPNTSVQYRPNPYQNYSHHSQGNQKTTFSGLNPYNSNVGQVPPYSSGNNYQQNNSSWSGYPSQNTANQRPQYYNPGGNNPHYNGSQSGFPSYTNRPNQGAPNNYPQYTGSQPSFQAYNTTGQRPPSNNLYSNGYQPSYPSYNNPSQRPPNSISYYNSSQPGFPSYNNPSQNPPYYQPTGHPVLGITNSGYSSYNVTTPKTSYNYQPLTVPPHLSASQNPYGPYQSQNSSVQIPPHNPYPSNGGNYPQSYPSYPSGPYNGNPNTAGQHLFHYPTNNNGSQYDPRKTPPGHFSY